MTDWMLMAAGAGVIAVLVALFAWRRSRRGLRKTPTVALVRRRRELQSRLQDLAGAQSESIARQEALRMNSSPMALEVLEAAVQRAEKLAASRR